MARVSVFLICVIQTGFFMGGVVSLIGGTLCFILIFPVFSSLKSELFRLNILFMVSNNTSNYEWI
jgi:hypothetical protein